MEKMPEGDNVEMSPAKEVFLARLEEINPEFDQLQFNIEADRGGGATKAEIVEKYFDAFVEVVSKYKAVEEAVKAYGLTDFEEFEELETVAIKVANLNTEHFFPKQ